MKEVNWEKIKTDIRTVGMNTFVNYYVPFQKLSTKELIELFEKNENWVYNSMSTKASKGRAIFKEKSEKSTLELIISSNTKKDTIEKASEIYLKNYPNEKIEKIHFIRPEFSFGEDIVENLFSGYKIISQYSVLDYFVDWYMPELNLVVEFDEKHHAKDYFDPHRQKRIEKELKCKFLRYKYD